MSKKNEVTAEAIVIEGYAIETANLKLENARLKIALNKLTEDNEENVEKKE